MRAPFAILVVTAACEIIDAGDPVGVADVCPVQATFYLERIVPEYLNQYKCAKVGCHDSATANSIFRLESTQGIVPPLPSDPLGTWPTAWQTNFQRVAAQVSDCSNAELSALYSAPAGGDTQSHGGGTLFPPNGDELALIQEWLAGAE